MSAKKFGFLALIATGLVAACGTPSLRLPEPRPMIIDSGARLSADEERLKTIYQWVDAQTQNITEDPTFFINAQPTSTDVYPWETLEIQADTAHIRYRRTTPDLRSVYEIYAHYHLMKEMGRAEEWIPEAAGMDGWEFERRAVARTTDAWLLGRASFGFSPARLMDELMYAQEAGQLEAYLLTFRGHEFPEEKEAWLAARPGADERFREWYRETFDREVNAVE